VLLLLHSRGLSLDPGDTVPDGIHLLLHIRSFNEMLEVVGGLGDSHLIELACHRFLVHHLHVLLLEELHVLELLRLGTVSFRALLSHHRARDKTVYEIRESVLAQACLLAVGGACSACHSFVKCHFCD